MSRNRGFPLLAGQPSSGASGVIGERQLIAVQTVDIARLTTHPVPIVPGTFVAVTGQGPKQDSNGSGKTTFLSAVSLLHCDSQWRLDLDGRHAAGLLFQPGAAGIDLGAGAAEHGYVIGVFTYGPAQDFNDPVTVWVRISRRAPYILMRYAVGLHVLHGATDQERSEQADEQWEALTSRNESGSRLMASTLFGMAPRCLAYLDTTLRPSVPSLLSQQMTQMSPERIGEALIALTGRDQLLDEEVLVRRKHADQSAVVATRVEEDRRDRLVEDAQLDELRRRGLARDALSRADRYWDSYLARGFLEKRELHADRTKELEDTQERIRLNDIALRLKKAEHRDWANNTDLATGVRAAEDRRTTFDQRRVAASKAIGRLGGQLEAELTNRTNLQLLAEGDDGEPVNFHTEAVAVAEEEYTRRLGGLAVAEERHRNATEQLEATRLGRAGLVGDTLSALDGVVTAVGLLDGIELDDGARSAWEPRLWRYRDAVVVAPQDRQLALDALTSVPGATVVSADGPLDSNEKVSLPDGVATSVPLATFLATIEERLTFNDEPAHVDDYLAGEAVLGGFADSLTGRASRIALAESEVSAASEEVARQSALVTQAETNLRRRRRLLEAASASVELDHVRKRIKAIEISLGDEQRRESDAITEWGIADEEHSKAVSAFDNHQAHLVRLLNEVTLLQNARGKLGREERVARDALDRVQIKLWEDTWSRPIQVAIDIIAADVLQHGDHPASWWHTETTVTVREALAFTAGSSGFEAMGGALNERPDTEPFEADAPNSPVFLARTRPIRDLLDSTSDSDAVLQDRIFRNRGKRQREIEEARGELNGMASDLGKQQEMVESSIETALRKISIRLDQLDQRRGWGARLDVAIGRPAGPEDSWTWHVTPRWRRSPAGGFISYREVANSAQLKIFAIQLVLAALLADDSVPGRLLVLDELGNSLGDANRKDVLSALHSVAVEQNITILGTCQDSVIFDAAGVCGEIIWFRHASASDPYNRPTRVWGFDADHNRVELTAAWLQAGRAE